MFHWQTIIRWIHILAGAAWLGEVITINLILVPAISNMPLTERKQAIANIFPRIFRLASALSLTTVSAGVLLNYAITGWQRLDLYVTSPRGLATSLGALLGLVLTAFHFFAESRLEGRVTALVETEGAEEVDEILRYLRIIPRAGLGVLVLIFLLMMIGARGF